MSRVAFVLAVLVSSAPFACTTTTIAPPPAASADAGGTEQDAGPPPPDPDLRQDLIDARPYKSKVPADYDASEALPLVLALHGRGDTGPNFVKYASLDKLVDERRLLLAYPTGEQVLAATGWAPVSDPEANGLPDDTTYLRAVIADMAARYNVDKKRVIVFGLSMGGFMAHYLGCHAADKITGIVAIAGSFLEPEKAACAPARSLNVIQLHGTKDTTVLFDGGIVPIGGTANYLSATELHQFWKQKNACSGSEALPAKDWDANVAGAESKGTRGTSCKDDASVTFWTIENGAHVPNLSKANVSSLLDAALPPAP